MASEIPIVRYFVPCLEIVVAPDRRDLTLRSLIHTIVRLPQEPFPCIRERMALYALLTNGRGEHEFAVELSIPRPRHRAIAATPRTKDRLGARSVCSPWPAAPTPEHYLRQAGAIHVLLALRWPAHC
jgi:hypothetical protein